MRFRLVFYDTTDQNKYASDRRHEYLGDRDAIWSLWFLLNNQLKKPHVEVFSLDGTRQHPELGCLEGMTDYNL